MSLINDALKRAKAAQQAAPPPLSEPSLRPAEADPAIRHGIGYAVPVALGCISLLIVFFGWRLSRPAHSPKESPAEPNSSERAAPAHDVSDEGSLRARARTSETQVPPTEQSAQTVAAPSGTPGAAGQSSLTPASTNAVAASQTTTSNAVLVGPLQHPAPPPLRLQGIVFNPRRPSAVVNGRTLFVGDRFGEFHVTRITPDTVTLAGGGKTNVLRLEE